MIKNHNLQAVSLKSTFSYYWACLRDQTPKSETGLPTQRFLLETRGFLIHLFLSINDVCASSPSPLPGYLTFGCKYFPVTVTLWFCEIMKKQFYFSDAVDTFRYSKGCVIKELKLKWGEGKDNHSISKYIGKWYIYNIHYPKIDFTGNTLNHSTLHKIKAKSHHWHF